MKKLDLKGMSRCAADVKRRFDSRTDAPNIPDDKDAVKVARRKLPRLYRAGFGNPIYRHRDNWELGAESEYYTFARRAIVQHKHGELARPTAAFQEVVADVYDGYLDEVERAGVWQPDRKILAPIVAWEPNDGEGPFHLAAYPEEGIDCGIVVLPESHSRGALAGWTFLAHEVAGHDIVGARQPLKDEIASNLRRRTALRKSRVGSYFAHRVEETICDIIGVLNMGPAAVVGLFCYFRGWNASFGYGSRLSREDESGEHPVETLRGLVAAQAVQHLEFDGVDAWHHLLMRLARRDFGRRVTIGKKSLTLRAATEAARIVAQTIATWSLDAIGGLSLNHIQNWRNDDEKILETLRGYLRRPWTTPRGLFPKDFYATHAVAAGMLESVRTRSKVSMVFDRTVDILKKMHRANKEWS